MRITTLFFVLFNLFFCQFSSAAFDWSDYSSLLSQHVTNGEKEGIHSNLVDYQAFSQDPKFSRLIERLALFDSSVLTGNEKIAFYLNAYNLLAIKLVSEYQPKKSIRDIGTWFSPVWQKPAAVIAGKTVSLDTIEHSINYAVIDFPVPFVSIRRTIQSNDTIKIRKSHLQLMWIELKYKGFFYTKRAYVSSYDLHLKKMNGETISFKKNIDWNFPKQAYQYFEKRDVLTFSIIAKQPNGSLVELEPVHIKVE